MYRRLDQQELRRRQAILEEIQVETNEFAFHHRFHHSINDLRRLQYKVYEGKILDAYLLVRHVGLHPERERERGLYGIQMRQVRQWDIIRLSYRDEIG
jgi:hypothetical protein